MKNKLKKATAISKADLALLKSEKAVQVLNHILSPLEQAAMDKLYQPFNYNYKRIPVYISPLDCKELLRFTRQKISLFHAIIQKETLYKAIPLRLRSVFNDPKEVLNLPPRLRNKLCRLGIHTLFDIILKGRTYFKEQQRLTKNSLHILDDLFKKYRCTNLFQ